MPSQTAKEIHQQRKDEHLSLALKYWKENRQTGNGLDGIRLIPNALPEIALSEIDISCQLFGETFEKPFYIEAMTGGSERGDKINAQLAELAKNQQLAMAVGSQSIALKYPELVAGFAQVRKIHKDGFLFANIGAGHGLEEAKRAVDMIEANALEIHVNLAQELTMRETEGDRSFYWLENINEIAQQLDCPVIVKEVGFGMSQQTFNGLKQTKVAAINLGSRGGTNFAWIERQRAHQLDMDHFGFNLAESLLEADFSENEKPLIATGGISKAEHIVKAQLLGAQMTSSAGAILSHLMQEGLAATEEKIENWTADLIKIYALLGLKSSADLKKVNYLRDTSLENFIQQRKNLA